MADIYRVLVARAPETEDFEVTGALPDGRTIERADVSYVQDHILAGVAEYQPHILVLDADSQAVDAFQCAKTIYIQRPDTSVIIISGNEQPDYLRRAMLSGAEEYLIKPVDSPTVMRAIVDVAEIQRQKQAARMGVVVKENTCAVVAVTSGKGGVGKTTIAVNLGIALAETGKKVIIIGLESGDAAVLMNLAPRCGILDLITANEEIDAQMLESCMVTHKSGVAFLTASLQFSGHSLEMLKSEYINRVVQILRESYDYIIVDLPLLLHPEDINTLNVADQILVLTSSWDLLVLRNTRTFLDSIPEGIRTRVKVILNRADRKDMIQEDDVRKSLQAQIAAIIANDSKLAPNSINVGVPFILSNPTAEISTDVHQLARLLTGEEVAEVKEEKRKKFRFFA
ncbi:MAG: hypothetical protein AUJ92_21095 [Armatimonadetes bacterium CG2_30_59_28]|nr:AAA family ATPase [Armatimonadota bacterium]OIO89584.1 MAG: hypothetical protein AUJ92_21095 [Armatimonadetes bacterium CG2_30_59_28]PIU66359.1 MAG: hypothetical protein COS85_05050 [Armatimonadetes bacterium CG07_land_8_20_14_0_80_59_28]PIX45857.1 MAG: hypothetical protein COZ56_00840 [Armatimonadetes bacterium CG_4_8_14_3_um_filter_58_9]PIY38715.1 MAG: hypothetical protein COZ05_20360 [Armatimonadetes bacterium CG_4_10_14_3_um_filter_59_10]PJB61629.1 MAG: hypothetical protein CO095_20205 